jgi:hypothetical protein
MSLFNLGRVWSQKSSRLPQKMTMSCKPRRLLKMATVALLPWVASGFGGGMFYGGGSYGYGEEETDCTSCPQACKDLNTKVRSTGEEETCSEAAYTDAGSGFFPAYCRTPCNNAECLRQNGRCGKEEIFEACTEKDKSLKPLRKASLRFVNSDGVVDAGLGLRIGQLKLQTTNAPNPTIATTPVEVTLSWGDHRWTIDPADAPVNATLVACRDVIAEAYKIPSKVAWPPELSQETVAGYYFLPKVVAKNAVTQAPYDTRTMAYDEGSSTVTTVSTFTSVFNQEHWESDTPYFNFPFDVHTLHMVFRASAARCPPTLCLNACSPPPCLLRLPSLTPPRPRC